MPWWVILIGVVVLGLLLDYFRNNRRSRPGATFEFITLAAARKRQEEATRLQPADEQLAQRVKKLFYSAAYHETRNVTAFHNVLKELAQITRDVLADGGRERMSVIADRVEWLCGDDRAGFAEFISIMRQSYLPANANT